MPGDNRRQTGYAFVSLAAHPLRRPIPTYRLERERRVLAAACSPPHRRQNDVPPGFSQNLVHALKTPSLRSGTACKASLSGKYVVDCCGLCENPSTISRITGWMDFSSSELPPRCKRPNGGTASSARQWQHYTQQIRRI